MLRGKVLKLVGHNTWILFFQLYFRKTSPWLSPADAADLRTFNLFIIDIKSTRVISEIQKPNVIPNPSTELIKIMQFF